MSNPSLKTLLSWLGIVILLPSVPTALAGLWMIGSGGTWWGDVQRTEGRVVALQTAHLNLGKGYGAHSIVEFKSHDDHITRVTDPVLRLGGAMHKVGDVVSVRYPKDEPEQAQISSSSLMQTIFGTVLIIVGGGGGAIGLIMFRFGRRRAPVPADAA